MVDKKVPDEKLKEMSGGTDDLQENQPNPGDDGGKQDLTKGNRPT